MDISNRPPTTGEKIAEVIGKVPKVEDNTVKKGVDLVGLAKRMVERKAKKVKE